MRVTVLYFSSYCLAGGLATVWASQVSHASYNVHQSPPSRLQDGVFQVMILR